MKIAELILSRLNRDYLLPSIQREFVWGRNDSKIEKLFDSIMQEYPFGTILTWTVNKDPQLSQINWEVYNFVQDYDEDNPHNALASINGYPQLNLILDGQQRLSALNIGLRGAYSYSYRNNRKRTKLFLNLFSDIQNDPDNNYGLKYEFKFLVNTPENPDEFWFEVGKVLDYYEKTSEDFKEDYDEEIRQRANSPELIRKAKMVLGQLHKTICSDDKLNEIKVSTDDDEKVLSIFVRTNDGGVKLEKADLLLSYMESNRQLFNPHGARKEIFNFVDSLNREELHKPNYEFSKDDILKACLVISDLEVQYKLKNFNSDNLTKISNNWDTIKKSLDLTINLIARYGFSSKNIISKNALIPIAYFLMKKQASPSFIASQSNTDMDVKNEIIKWLAVSQLTGAFGSAADSTLRSIREFINEGKSFKEINLGKVINKDDVEKWINRESYNSKYSHLLLLLITKAKYWDECHQDHIFPQSKFNSRVYQALNLTELQINFYEKYANSIINIHLLNPAVNIVKSDDDFIDWSAQQNEEFFESSLIPRDIDLSFSNFEAFINQRKELLINKIYTILSNR